MVKAALGLMLVPIAALAQEVIVFGGPEDVKAWLVEQNMRARIEDLRASGELAKIAERMRLD